MRNKCFWRWAVGAAAILFSQVMPGCVDIDDDHDDDDAMVMPPAGSTGGGGMGTGDGGGTGGGDAGTGGSDGGDAGGGDAGGGGADGGGGGGDAGGGGGDSGGGAALDPDVPPITKGLWYRPGVDTTWQWQLQPNSDGVINTSYDVDLYDIDLFDVDAAVIKQLQGDGRRVICYFSAGSFESFRDDAGEFVPGEIGTTLDGFPDERWLDIRSGNVHRIMLARLDVAMAKGCDGVEPDNVAAFDDDTGFDFTATDQLAFNKFIANAAHMRGLSVGLKNDLTQIEELVDYYDFSVNEQCHEFDECETEQPFIDAGKPVFSAEYADRFVGNAAERDSMCASARDAQLHTLILPLDLDDSFRLSCDP